MKPKLLLILSVVMNVALAIVLGVCLKRTANSSSAPTSHASPDSTEQAISSPALSNNSNCPAPTSAFDWRSIESSDYRQYVANLHAIDCPEHTIRDIIVADIDQLYATKSRFTPAVPPPWQNADRRRVGERDNAARVSALRAEKRAFVKELIGYEWDNHANEVWHQDFMAGLLLGFLPDDKAPRLLSVADKYNDLAADAKAAANDILIDEDFVRLRRLYDDLTTEASQMLSPAERDEVELRIQAGIFLVANDIHWDGVHISGAQLREFVRLSRRYQDAFREQFLATTIGEEQTRNNPLFLKDVEKILGPTLYADYVRAQDSSFRELAAFLQEHNLSATAASRIYAARQAAETEARRINGDGTFSRDEKQAALLVLKTSTAQTISSALGKAYRDYAEGPGHWVVLLAPEAAAPAPNTTP